ncbi:MAG: hypothetical protein LBC88_04830 [Spirochaetaceae bacterium]|jgi:hypothetical protein|nr:hypothetical protein [Spirochaetaceae bacterium]
MKVTRFVLPVFFALFALPLNAYTVSVMIAETALPLAAPLAEASIRWETGFMDTFFDAGHIVSNAPLARLAAAAGEVPAECMDDLYAAGEGGVDYFILVLLNYEGYTGTGAPRPVWAELKMFRVTPYRLVAVTRFPAPGKTLETDHLANAREAARMLLPHF